MFVLILHYAVYRVLCLFIHICHHVIADVLQDRKIPGAPWMTHVCASHWPHVGCHFWGTLGYATIFHVVPMCLASQRTHMGPKLNPYVFAICIAHVGPICDYHYGATRGLSLLGHTGVCSNFPRGPMCFAWQSTHMGPTHNPCVFTICVALLDKCVITFCGVNVSCF